jgi:hypothetical protein
LSIKKKQTRDKPLKASHHRAINKFSGAVAGEKEDFCKGSFARTSFTLF